MAVVKRFNCITGKPEILVTAISNLLAFSAIRFGHFMHFFDPEKVIKNNSFDSVPEV